jgi:hypothetical protein
MSNAISADSREQLEAFVERAARLERSRYFKKFQEEGGTAWTIQWNRDAGCTLTNNFPDEEAIDAVVLTARLFCQGNDLVALKNIAKLDDDVTLSDEWKSQFRATREALNTFLDSLTVVTIDGKYYSYREIFDIFLYGGLAHTNRTYAPIYRQWKGNPIIEQQFHKALFNLLDAALYVGNWTREELAGRPVPVPEFDSYTDAGFDTQS